MEHGEPRRAERGSPAAQLADASPDAAAVGSASGPPANGAPAAPRRRGILRALYRSLRLHQWAKNLLVFAPLVLGGKAGDLAVWSACAIGFVGFGLFASTTYLINDLRDRHDDRKHWSKSRRPIANGDISVRAVWVAIPIGLAAGLGVTALVSWSGAVVLAAYGLITLGYSLYLKRVPILDVFTISVLFTLRLVFGIVLAAVDLSPWLLVFSIFLFLSLSLSKRYVEVLRTAALGRERVEGRGYLARDAHLLLALGTATGVAAVIIMVIYLVSDVFEASIDYASPQYLWGAPPILLLWVAHIWLQAGRGQLDDDPLRFAVTDSVSLGLGLAMAAVFVCAWQL